MAHGVQVLLYRERVLSNDLDRLLYMPGEHIERLCPCLKLAAIARIDLAVELKSHSYLVFC